MSKRRKNPRTSEPKPAKKTRDVFVSRPFAGLTDEVDWIAMRELLPSATSPLRLKSEYVGAAADRPITLATVLPLAWPAMARADGHVFVAAQRQFSSGDVSRDIAASLLAALSTPPGQPVAVPSRPGPGPRMQDLLTADGLDITIHDSFTFWLAEGTDASDPQVRASMERADSSIYPSEALSAMPGAYWCSTPEHAHARVVLPEDEDVALAALARLRGDDRLKLIPESKFAGMFRTHGVLVPVWDLPPETSAKECEEPVAEFAVRYAEALASDEPLTPQQRRARDGLVGRQLTLR
ncbi:DUF5926 family protein [Stackebrandtia soli]|uniref:DUF5926 family protein n=1 Tax=Stackebrandtia soli TaxID=1892856 RepID=UPI0039E9D5FF